MLCCQIFMKFYCLLSDFLSYELNGKSSFDINSCFEKGLRLDSHVLLCTRDTVEEAGLNTHVENFVCISPLPLLYLYHLKKVKSVSGMLSL